MKIGFTTLGTPDWDLDTICERGREFGFDGVDFRGIGEQIDITLLPEFTTGLGATAAKLEAAGLAGGVSTSLKICDAQMMDQNVEEAVRAIPVAKALGIGVVRVFGGGDPVAHSVEALADVGQETMEAVLALDGARDLQWVLETHDHWISSSDCKMVLDRVPDPAFGILWDIGHTSRVGAEDPEASLDVLGDRVYHLHVKDAIHDSNHPDAMQDGWRYVDPGTGQLPLAPALRVLQGRGYDRWVIFEHEKRWHAELPEPEEVFPKFMAWIKGILE
ncbi:MAG: sugar phosphate isomerase/epimerase [Candidatus Latescibacteria bacterium]|nr:sugar phosphate isomerase/epimerase [Candidatus Latescibacterota bacterium]